MEKAIDKVKRKLWTFGYSVQEVSGVPGVDYDLLVDGRFQVKVALVGRGDIEAMPKRITIAIVDNDEIRYSVCQSGKCWEEVSPLKAFPKREECEMKGRMCQCASGTECIHKGRNYKKNNSKIKK